MTDLFGEQLSPCLKDKIHNINRTKGRRTLYEYFNLDLFGNLPTTGKEQMPIINPIDNHIDLPKEMMAFDVAYSKKNTNCIVHFYTDDRRFLRIIRNPEKYVPFLKECKAVIEPDLSQYANMPYPIRLAHAWLNRAIAAWLQLQGVKIIQNVTWSLKDSYGYSLEGRAKNTIVAVNSTGVRNHDVSKYLWNEGYKNVVLPLSPTKILRYGNQMPNEKADISVYFSNPNLNKMHHGR